MTGTPMKFENASLPQAQFTDVNLRASQFVDVALAGASFSDVSLAGSKFDNVNFSDVTITDVNLAGASFSNVSLGGAKFDNVNFGNVTITDVNLEGMKINGVLVSDLFHAYGAGGKMQTTGVISQLRTTDLAASIRFYTAGLGLPLEFQYQDFYAGIRAGTQLFHLKLVDDKDPSIEFVAQGGHFHLYLETDDAAAMADALKKNGVVLVKEVHETAWGTREFVIHDDQGHTLYFGEPLRVADTSLGAGSNP